MPSSRLLIGCLAAGLAFSLASPAIAQDLPPWQSADQVASHLFEAQLALYRPAGADDGRIPDAADAARRAEALYRSALRPSIEAADPQAAHWLDQAFAAAFEAVKADDPASLAAARGRIWTGLIWGAYRAAAATIAAGDLSSADAWIRLREFRRSTRISVVDNHAAEALEMLAAGKITPDRALSEVQDDLRDSVNFRVRDSLDQFESDLALGYRVRAAEWAGRVNGYAQLLRPDLAEKLGPAAAGQAAAAAAGLERAVLDNDPVAAADQLAGVRSALADYEPVVLSAADLSRRSQLLYLFIDLVAVEYRDGVRNGQISIETEYLEAVTFRDQAEVLFGDLRHRISAADPAAADRLEALLAGLESDLEDKVTSDRVQAQVDEALALIESALGSQGMADDLSASFDVIDSLLDEMLRQARAGDYLLAEQTRIQAYAVFDAGPELRLLGIAPAAVARLDGLFWQGYDEQAGLAALLPLNAPVAQVEEVRSALGEGLQQAEQALTRGASPLAVTLNSSVIVFREGLEAVVILAALLAGLSHAGARRLRRSMLAGALLSLIATVLTWVLARELIVGLARFGERLEAVVSLVAVAVLLLVTNWFFHRVYWKDWLAQFHRMKGRLLGAELGQLAGLVLLGFVSVYREGFETVLFLQALVLEAGPLPVMQGVVAGLLAVGAIGYLTFRFQRRLPYRQMLVVTGMLIGLVLVIMVGKTAHVMQAIGWLPIAPLRGVQLPYWMGLWLGVFPTWQSLLTQGVAAVFVLASYYLAELRMKARRGRAGSSNLNTGSATVPPG